MLAVFYSAVPECGEGLQTQRPIAK